jgi:hypothetical protein
MLRAFSLPREAILLRRMADLLYVGCSQLRAAADWWALARELQIDGQPRTALAREHTDWRTRKTGGVGASGGVLTDG